MANTELQMGPQMEQIHGDIRDTSLYLLLYSSHNLMQNANMQLFTFEKWLPKLDKIKGSNRLSKQLEELTGKMRECKRLIKEIDREIKDEESRNPSEVKKQLNDEKQSMQGIIHWMMILKECSKLQCKCSQGMIEQYNSKDTFTVEDLDDVRVEWALHFSKVIAEIKA